MKNNQELLNELNKDIKDLEYKVENRRKYNLKIFPKAFFIGSMICIDKLIPFATSAVIGIGVFHSFNQRPFQIEKIKEYASVEQLITSNGYEQKVISYDTKYEENSIVYTTKWNKNEYDLYERVQTTYKFNKNFDIDTVLNMSLEEIKDCLEVLNIEKIQKSYLSEDDLMYDDTMVIVKEVIESDEYSRVRNETNSENILQTSLYILVALSLGLAIRCIKHVVIKRDLVDNLYYMHAKYKFITPYDIKTLKEILELKKENLKLFEESGEKYESKHL